MADTEHNLSDRRSTLSDAKRALLEERLRRAASRAGGVAQIPRRSERSGVALSFAQERLWLLEQLEPGQTAYNISRLFKFEGRLDEPALQRALDAIVARHESLRTSFTVSNGRPLQVVTAQVTITPVVVDLSNVPDQRGELKRLANAEAQRPFDLSRAPLLRLHLVHFSETEHGLLLTMHHIISDFWSLEIFHRELSTLYDAFANGGQASLTQLPIQYADYAEWQRTQTKDSQIQYWRQQLAAIPGALNLSTDKQRPARLSFKGGFQSLSLSRELTQKLYELARHERATLFMIILAAFNVLLHRYSGQEDILVGVPMTGRNRVETEDLIGFFVNTVVLRGDLSGEPTFRQVLTRIRQVTLSAYENQEVPFERLVQELKPPRGIGHSPFFQVMLDVQTLQDHNTHGHWQAENLEIDRCGARADLLLFVTESRDSLDCWLEYSTDLFESATAARLLEHFGMLLNSVVDHPDQRASALEFLTPDERRQLLAWNQISECKVNKTIAELFAVQVARTPEAVALTCEKQSLTYRELNRRANQLANHLQQIGVGAEVLVALCLDRSIELVVTILAVLKAGGAYLPLDPSYPDDRLQFMLADAGAPVLITEEKFRTKFDDTDLHVVLVDRDAEVIARERDETPKAESTPENLAYVIYTSGSTGQPKGVSVTQANVVRLLDTTAESFKFNSADVWTLFHSYAFDFSVWELWGALLCGGRLVVVPYWISRSPDEFFRLLCQEQVTVLNQTPSAFRQLIQAEASCRENDGLPLRLVIFGGEALDMKALIPWWERHGDRQPQLVNMYGITETTVHVTYRPLKQADLDESGRSMIGQGLGDLQVYILDQHQQLVPVGVPGEMYVGGAGLSRGYLHRKDLTAQRFVPHPFSEKPGHRLYRTGDVARYQRNGDLEYLGRCDRQVKVRGFRIELGEIEAMLGQHEDLRQCVVIPGVEEQDEQQLTAYVVPHEGRTVMIESVRSFVRQRLPSHMVPAFFVVLEKFPLTANGKIDLQALPAPEKSRADTDESLVAPRTEVERRLADIWSEVLGRKNIGIHDNFFDLGGHSLLAAQVVARVGDSFKVKLPLRNFFDKPTVAALAEFVSEANESPTLIPAIKRLPRG